jgi:glutathione peroxidase-family protein
MTVSRSMLIRPRVVKVFLLAVMAALAVSGVQGAANSLDQELQSIGSFFDLSARDIDGKPVDFDQFRGSVTILVNVASYCGYTKSHYEGLVELWSHVEGENVQILAFPCNQFGKQEPGSAAEIKDFAKSEGVKFRMMEKINVNGPDTSIVYKYLKNKAGPGKIQWNFATYFVVGPDGDVQSHSGVEPMQLKDLALNLLKEEL